MSIGELTEGFEEIKMLDECCIIIAEANYAVGYSLANMEGVRKVSFLLDFLLHFHSVLNFFFSTPKCILSVIHSFCIQLKNYRKKIERKEKETYIQETTQQFLEILFYCDCFGTAQLFASVAPALSLSCIQSILGLLGRKLVQFDSFLLP